MNIIAPARSVPSATSRSASLPIKTKLPTGAVIAGIGSVLAKQLGGNIGLADIVKNFLAK